MKKTDNNSKLVWEINLSSEKWDRNLAAMGGHPLQSALWGDARARVDKIKYHRWVAYLNDKLVWMIRFEVRRIPLLGKVAWVPKLTSCSVHSYAQYIHAEFLARLRRKNFLMAIESHYLTKNNPFEGGISISRIPRTILVDLRVGKHILWSNLQIKWRWRVRAAKRAGVEVKQSRKQKDLSLFFRLCQQVSRQKKFDLPNSEELMFELIKKPLSKHTESRLFIAQYGDKIAGGAMVLQCGTSLHYIWGATNRKFAKKNIGHIVQWEIMKWAVDQGLERYDLEGIDPEENQGVYEFKRKMGGKEITLPATRVYSLNLRGKIALWAGRKMKRL